MKKNKKYELDRFHQIFFSTGLSKNQFASILGTSPSNLQKYFNGETDLKHLSKKLFELGYSIDWLYGEIGTMVHNQENIGRDLSYLSNFDIEMQKERIKIWIENTFRSISKFEEATGLEPGIVSKFLFSDDVMNYEIFRILKSEGCNILWTYTGTGKKFLDNRNGKINKTKYLKSKNKKS